MVRASSLNYRDLSPQRRPPVPNLHQLDGRDRSRADFEAMSCAIGMHRLRPVIDRHFAFAEAREAYRYLEGRSHVGKVVIPHN